MPAKPSISARADQLIENEQPRLIRKEVISCPLPKSVTVYASGTNRVADVQAAVAAGVPSGVDVSRRSARAMEEILRSSLPVLLDSGAFSEVAVRDGGIELASPITNQEWKRRLAIYLRIARASSPRRSGLNSVARVTVVAPDRVGSQELTLARLTQFRAEMREVHLAGADILVPLQVGLLGLPEFYDAAAKVIGIGIVPACR